jgi:hypothetical protein
MYTLLAGPALFLAALGSPGPECPVFIRGDANQDGTVDLADPIRTLDYLFQDGTSIGCHDAADADDGGTIDITDPIYLLLFLFSGGRPPPHPGPLECGRDETTDDLECLAGEGCRPQPFLKDFSEFVRFDSTLEPGLGFCPEMYKVFRASILREETGYRLEMSVLYEGVPGQPECIEVVSGACAVELPLPPRMLTAEEEVEVRNLFSAVPIFEAPHTICLCLAIDPCVIPAFEWDGFRARGFECSAPRLPANATANIKSLLEGLRP